MSGGFLICGLLSSQLLLLRCQGVLALDGGPQQESGPNQLGACLGRLAVHAVVSNHIYPGGVDGVDQAVEGGDQDEDTQAVPLHVQCMLDAVM